MKRVTIIEDAELISPMWQEFVEIVAGQEWKFTPSERAWIRAAQEIMNQPMFLEAIEDGCEVD